MITRTSRSIPWDIYEEHLDEAEFLWWQWEDALIAANFTLHDVAVGPEARLLAHLDGLVLGGAPVATELLLPALTSDDPRRIAAAAWGLVQSEHGADYQNSVLDVVVNGEPPVRAAIARALALAPQADLGRAAQLWPIVPPAVRTAVFDLVSPRDPDRARPWIAPGLRSGELSLTTAALRALRRMPDRAFNDDIDDLLKSGAPEVRVEAIAAGVVSKSNRAWQACRSAATESGEGRRLPLGLLATSTHSEDRATVRACASDTDAKRHAIWALGFTGDIEAADVLVEATEDDAVARIAGESLSAITGLVLGRAMVKPGKTVGPNVQEVGDDDPPPIVRTEDHLVLPDAKAMKTWWHRERTRFRPGLGQIQGRLRTPDSVHAALATTSMWRREVLWLDLARTTGTPPKIDLKAWSADQRRQWRADGAASASGR